MTGDHCTPASPDVIHSGDPVPFVVAGPGVRADAVRAFGELDLRRRDPRPPARAGHDAGAAERRRPPALPRLAPDAVRRRRRLPGDPGTAVDGHERRHPAPRSFEISPSLFRTLAITSATALWLIVVTGATVRLTSLRPRLRVTGRAARRAQPFPGKGVHSFIEFGNRLVGRHRRSLRPSSRRSRRGVSPALPRWSRWTARRRLRRVVRAGAAGLPDCALRAQSVSGHVALSALRRRARRRRGARHRRAGTRARHSAVASPARAPPRRRRRGRGLPDPARHRHRGDRRRPAPGRPTKVHRLWRLQDAVFAHAVGTAIFGLCFAFMLGYLVSRRSSAPRLLWLALAVLGLVGVQIADRRDPVPHASALVARADPRRNGGLRLGRQWSRSRLSSSGRLPRSPARRLRQWPTSSGFSSGRR